MAHTLQLAEAGVPLAQAKKALVLLHGRGATAEDILSLTHHLPVKDFYIAAPQATNYTWYPYSFLSPIKQNEPWLSSALAVVASTIEDIKKAGITSENIYLMGFSQGACLTLEFATRHAQRWGGVVAFTGGLIGDAIEPSRYQGSFNGTPVLMTNSQNDPHVPLQRSEDSEALLQKMGANVSLEIFMNRPHTILTSELQKASELVR